MADLAGPLLALDSSTPTGSAAIGVGGQVLAEISLAVTAGHSSALLPAIDQIMKLAGVKPEELGGILVGSGPGSFTGLRIAAATAKGMAHALGIPLVAFSSLLAAAAPYGATDEVVGALFDARGRDVFAACYRFGDVLETLVPPGAMTLEGALDKLLASGAARLVGDGATRHARELGDRLGARVVDWPFQGPRGAALIWLADRHPEIGVVTSSARWEPEYLRPSGAERIAAAKVASTPPSQ